MAKSKSMRTRGKTPISRQFQNLNSGDSIAVVRELSLDANFPKRLQGRTGIVAEKRGRAYVVAINDFNKPKRFIIEPVHLKKITLGNRKK